jgi:hypothetical protein
MPDDPNVATPPSGTTAPASAAPAPAPVAPAPSARQENLVPQSVVDRITSEKWDAVRGRESAERQAAALQATVEELRRGATAPASAAPAPAPAPAASEPVRASAPAPARPLTQEELARLVAEQTDLNAFNARCNEAAAEGKKAHGDFDTVVLRDLANLSPVYDPVAQRPILPRTLVEAALETGDAHEVLYALGKDQARAEALMRLPPVRQAVEVAKFHAELVASRGEGEPAGGEEEPAEGEETAGETAAPAPRRAAPAPPGTSRAPAPLRTAAGRGGGGTRPAFDINDTSRSSTAEWIAKRQAEVNAKRANGSKLR